MCSALIDPADLTHETASCGSRSSPSSTTSAKASTKSPAARHPLPPRRPPGGLRLPGASAKASRASGIFLRRVFWLAPHNRDQRSDGLYATGAPSEAVDPCTLRPRTKGYKTERSEGGPASDGMREMGITLPKS
ncbi:hypothetical protein SALB_00763 [Streptomyces noursei]|uniref:Uncharacterized protein n=1 Tax=Streptomyces noursei TaxID=1971 RepID=A0A401QRT8_STRNR|nr:hypothetical protein SALB_00763 [Streptomyces noursei]